MSAPGGPRPLQVKGAGGMAPALSILLVLGCAEQRIDGIFTMAEWVRVQTLSPLPAVPADPTNSVADDPRAAELGQMLFFETGYSGPIVTADDGTNGGLGAVGQTGRISCASCHSPTGEFDDERSMPNATSLGADWTGRNAPTLINVAFYEWFFWDGRADSLWMQALMPVEAPNEMASDRLRVVHVLFDQYRDVYDAIFEPDLDPQLGDLGRFPASGMPGVAAWDSMAPADQEIVNRAFTNFGKAIAAYERLIVTTAGTFDRYVSGEMDAIPVAAKRGLSLFIGTAACTECHQGPFLSDQLFHDIGVAQRGPHAPAVDEGRFAAVAQLLSSPFNGGGVYSDDPTGGAERLAGLAQDESLHGRFRTKSLREISMTAPYMHDGAIPTLPDAIEFYNRGGPVSGDVFAGQLDPLIRPLHLSARDSEDLVAFLQTLASDTVPPALREDTSR